MFLGLEQALPELKSRCLYLFITVKTNKQKILAMQGARCAQEVWPCHLTVTSDFLSPFPVPGIEYAFCSTLCNSPNLRRFPPALYFSSFPTSPWFYRLGDGGIKELIILSTILEAEVVSGRPGIKATLIVWTQSCRCHPTHLITMIGHSGCIPWSKLLSLYAKSGQQGICDRGVWGCNIYNTFRTSARCWLGLQQILLLFQQLLYVNIHKPVCFSCLHCVTNR